MEVNANPSLNVYSDTLLPNGDIEQNLSELDKYVKTNLVSDTLRLVTTPSDQLTNEIGSLKKILPAKDQSSLDELYLYSTAEEIFEILSGMQGFDFLTIQQFTKLSKFPELSSKDVTQAHYQVIYKTVVMRSDNNQMDLNCFFEAIEEIANRLYGKADSYDNLVVYIECMKNLIGPKTKNQQ